MSMGGENSSLVKNNNNKNHFRISIYWALLHFHIPLLHELCLTGFQVPHFLMLHSTPCSPHHTALTSLPSVSPTALNYFFLYIILPQTLSGGTCGKESTCNASGTRDPGSIPGSGRCPGGGNGHPLQYSCLKNSMDRGPWRAAVHGVVKVLDTTEHVCTRMHIFLPQISQPLVRIHLSKTLLDSNNGSENILLLTERILKKMLSLNHCSLQFNRFLCYPFQ